MTVVLELEVDADEFSLGRILTADLDVEVRVERVVPTAGRVLPYVWVDGPDAGAFGRHVAPRDAVESIAELERVDGRILYRIDWEDGFECLVTGVGENRGAVLEARGADRWTLRLRFPSHESLSGFHDYCDERGVSTTIVRISSVESETPDRHELTVQQRRALEIAVERGYFAVPRDATLSELADELDVSSQAASERVRRGVDAVLRAELGDGSS